MAKIIKIKDDIIYMGLDNGAIKEVRKEDLSFEPTLGMKVDIFENETTIIVTPVEERPVEKEESTSSNYSKNDGINIVVNNASNNQGTKNSEPNPNLYVPNPTTGKVVNKLTYCLLAFFLGGIGIHKFYGGKTGTGILFLLFCWTGIPAVIALIDLIIGICKPADSQGNIVV